jgi:hypothetical protein
MLPKRRKMMTKRFHKCDDSCKVNHTTPKKSTKKPIKNLDKTIEKAIKKTEIIIKKEKPTLSLIDEIEFHVCKIDNELETNKILEKTLIKLRKLEKDIA